MYVKFKSIFLYRQTGIYNKRKKRRLSAKERTDLSSPNACARDFVLIFLSQASTLSLRGPEIGFTQHDRLRSCYKNFFLSLNRKLTMILKHISLFWDLAWDLQPTTKARDCLIHLRESAEAKTLIIDHVL